MTNFKNTQLKVLDIGSHILRGEKHYNGNLWELKLSKKGLLAPTKKLIKNPNRRSSDSEYNNPGGVYTFEVNGENHILETYGDFNITPYRYKILKLWGVNID